MLGAGAKQCKPQTLDQALLLAGVYMRLCQHLLNDLGRADTSAEPDLVRWRRRREKRTTEMLAQRLVLGSIALQGAVQMPMPMATYSFVAGLPPTLVRDVVRWAPPVVGMPAGPDAPAGVVENLFSAFLAKHAIPGELVGVKRLATRTNAKFSVIDLARMAEPILAPIFQQHRDRIIRIAPSTQVAKALSGLERSMVARIRKPAADGKRPTLS